MQRLEELLNTQVEYKGEVVYVKDMDLNDQISFLIHTDFKFFASDEMALYRIENLYYIMDKNSKKVPFKLNKAQRHFYENYIIKGYYKIIILKSRQIGFTTFISLYFLDKIIFNPNTEALQIAHLKTAAMEIFNRKIKYALNNLTPAVKAILTTNTKNANRLEFAYPDGAISAIGVASTGVSGTYRLLHISELGPMAEQFPEKAVDVIKNTLPAVPMDGFVAIESTARGMNSIFYEMYMNSYKRIKHITPSMSKAEFYPVFYNWQWDKEEIAKACVDGIIPIADMEEAEIDWQSFKIDNNLTDEEMTYYYIKWIQSGKDIDKLFQEYPIDVHTAFASSGASFFPLRKINEFYEKCDDSVYTRYNLMNGQLIEDIKGELWLSEQPERGRAYLISADVASGVSDGDYSTCFIFGADKRVCGFFRGHLDGKDFAELLFFLGTKYNTAKLVVESNFDGGWVNRELVDNGYTNIYFKVAVNDINKSVTNTYGFRTDMNSRKFILNATKLHFRSLTELNCSLLLKEMMTFIVNKRQKPEAASGAHDDLCMAYSIGIGSMENQKDVVKDAKPFSIMDYLYS